MLPQPCPQPLSSSGTEVRQYPPPFVQLAFSSSAPRPSQPISPSGAGEIVGKQPCPKTTPAKIQELKADGYVFHSSGQYRNNWVRGLAPPKEEGPGRVFDPRGDWSRGSYGTGQVPGMDDSDGPKAGAGKGKKKKKKKAGAKPGAEDEEDDEEEADCAKGKGSQPLNPSASQPPAEASQNKEYSTPEEVNKRLKAVTKKLRQAEDLAAQAAEGKDLNVDQKAKIAAVAEMKEEIDNLTQLLNTM